MDIPFFHPVLIGITVVGAFVIGPVVQDLVPSRFRWRGGVPMLAGILVSGVVVSGGWVPLFGRLHLAAYTAFMLAGFALGMGVMLRRATPAGFPRHVVSDVVLIAAVLGIVGARARYVWERWDRILAEAGGDRHQALLIAADLDRGGAVWYGGVLLATIGILVYLRWQKASALRFADLLMPGLLAGLAIGRIGCFVNGCCYGAPTDLPWGVVCDHYPGKHVHPAQLYETLACAVIAAALWWWWPRRRIHGLLAMIGVVAYAAWRFFNEGLRGDHDVFAWGTITTSQGTSLWLAAAGIAGAAYLLWRGERLVPSVRS